MTYQNLVIKHQKKIMVAEITQKQPKVLSACELEKQSPTGYLPPQILLQLVFFIHINLASATTILGQPLLFKAVNPIL